MRTIRHGAKFSRDLKRLRSSADKQTLLDAYAVIELLANDEPLPERFRDHPLKGDWKPSRDCHIRPDLILIYTKPPGELYLRRLASHAELF